MKTGVRVGIDFGTSNSGVGYYDGANVQVLPLDHKSPTPGIIKTILYITREQETYIGQEAIDLYYRHNLNRPRRFERRWVGEIEVYGGDMYFIRDVYVEVDVLNPGRLLQQIKTGLRLPGYEGTLVFDQYYDLQKIISLYLGQLKRRAEQHLQQPIRGVVLGRPVKFMDDPAQDQKSQAILQQAAYDAGFEEVDFELEPVAAARYFELTLSKPQTALVFDFGGGTLDITIMKLGDPANRQVFAVGGIGIAGADFDRLMIQNHLLEYFGKYKVQDAEIDRWIDAIADWQVIPEMATPKVREKIQQEMKHSPYINRLKALEALIFNNLAFSFYNKVEAAKIALSEQHAALIQMEQEDIHIWELLTRLQFETDLKRYRQKIQDCLLDTLNRSGLSPLDVDIVIKTGGSSNIPYFHQMLVSIFNRAAIHTSDVFSSVTAGLAVRAYDSMA